MYSHLEFKLSDDVGFCTFLKSYGLRSAIQGGVHIRLHTTHMTSGFDGMTLTLTGKRLKFSIRWWDPLAHLHQMINQTKHTLQGCIVHMPHMMETMPVSNSEIFHPVNNAKSWCRALTKPAACHKSHVLSQVQRQLVGQADVCDAPACTHPAAP